MLETVRILDAIKQLGFEYATKAGFSISVNDMIIPEEKDTIVKKSEKEVKNIQNQHQY